MVRNARLLMFGRHLVLAAATLLMSGCAITTTMYADEQIRPYLRSLSKRPEQPLARSLTWKYHYSVGRDDYEQSWFIADGNLIRSAEDMAGVQLYTAQPATSGTSQSDVFTMKAREASARGRHQAAQTFHGLSEVSLQTQIAAERTAATLALASALRNLGAALLDVSIISNAQAVANYLSEDSRSIIGAGAPDGTVLELFFRGHKADGPDAAPVDIIMTWEAVATLKDADGKLWRSSASYKTYHTVAFGSQPPPAPEQFRQSRYVRMDAPTLLPADHGGAYTSEFAEIMAVSQRGGAVPLAIVAATAIEGLYEQLAYVERQAGR